MASHPIFTDDMREIVESFVVETQEIFEELDNDLLQLERTPDDRELIDRIFRAVHTVKGTSGFLSLEQLSHLTHYFEDVLNRLRRSEIDFRPEMMDVMLRAFDQMKVLVQQVITQQLVPLDLDALVASLQAIASGATPAALPTAEIHADEDAGEEAPGHPVQEPPSTETQAQETPTPKAEVSEPAPDEASASGMPEQPSDGAIQRRVRPTETIRVEVERLDNLMDLVGELVLGRNRLLQIVSDLRTTQTNDDVLRELADTNAQVDFITTELQAAVMRTRMVQIGRVFNKFPRVVRDLAKEFEKEITLIIEGEETELDKSLVEEISDPLVHLIRNAADHGIEQPEVRRAAGKPARGTVRLTAEHEGNNVVIEIADDGAGIDTERVKAKALEKGLITQKEAAELSDTQAFELLFQPGLSTAQHVSKVSGRGVGMDVVKTNITRLNGTITVASTPGQGSRFTLKLPLTLAIIQGLLVRVGRETFAIPLHSVIEVVSLDDSEVSTIHGREVIHLRKQVLPLLHVGRVLRAEGYDRTKGGYAVIIGVAHHRLGLIVDGLTGQKEVVIKPLGAYLKKVAGIAGSTILGDGRVIMILDVGELVRMELDKQRHRGSGSRGADEPEHSQAAIP